MNPPLTHNFETTSLMNSPPSPPDPTHSGNEASNHPLPLVANVAGEKEEEPFPTSMIKILSISIALGLVSGSLYGFGRYARALKQVLNISQSQVQSFGIWLDCGNYIGHPVTGMIYDRYGPACSCLLAAVIVFASYATIHLVVTQKQSLGTADSIPHHSMLLLKFSFAGVGFGSGLGYISGLGSTTKQFLSHPKYLGRAVGLVAAGYGSSATIVGLTYKWMGLHQECCSSFFLFWAVAVALVNAVAAFILRSSSRRHARMEAPPGSLRQQPLLEKTEISLTDLNVVSPAAMSEDHVQRPSNSENCVGEAWQSWRDSRFWVLFLSFACVTGCGLFVINNLSTMTQSIGATDAFSGKLIIVLSCSNVIGRIVMGALGDARKGGSNIQSRKLILLQMATIIMAVALIIFGMLSPLRGHESICLTVVVVLVPFAYGGSWVIVVAIVAEFFGKVHFGKDYGLLAMGPALSGMIVNSISALYYDRHTSSGNDVCIGPECYQVAYAVTGISALVGCIVAIAG